MYDWSLNWELKTKIRIHSTIYWAAMYVSHSHSKWGCESKALKGHDSNGKLKFEKTWVNLSKCPEQHGENTEKKVAEFVHFLFWRSLCGHKSLALNCWKVISLMDKVLSKTGKIEEEEGDQVSCHEKKKKKFYEFSEEICN